MDKHCQNANFISLVKCTRQRQTETLQQASCFLKYQRRHALFAKRKVMEAAFNAAIMYGCESWLAMDKLYSIAYHIFIFFLTYKHFVHDLFVDKYNHNIVGVAVALVISTIHEKSCIDSHNARKFEKIPKFNYSHIKKSQWWNSGSITVMNFLKLS